MLTTQEIDLIADQSAAKVLKALRNEGLMAPRFPARMNTAQVAEAKGGVTRQTVQLNWKRWGLKCLGRGAHGEFQFEGLSVQRHIERENS